MRLLRMRLRKEGSGTELYPNAGQGWNVRKGVRMQLWF